MNYSSLAVGVVIGLIARSHISAFLWKKVYQRHKQTIQLQNKQINAKDEIIQMLKNTNENKDLLIQSKDQLIAAYRDWKYVREDQIQRIKLN